MNAARVVEVFRRRFSLAALLLLCLATYLPGILRLPAVDRTEVIWAESTRDMVARGAWLDPRYEGAVHAFRPIGTFWAQGVAAKVFGDAHARDIRVYRSPGLVAVTLAVLALYGLANPLVGTTAAFYGAALFAVAPLTVLLSQLAIADGVALLPATVAMLCLLRIYAARPEDETRNLAWLFWGAVGLGMLVNALHTPILVCATLAALAFFDRDFGWLKRMHAVTGLPLAFALAAPWLIVRIEQDGVPFAGLEFKKILAALGGAQNMKLRAFPGTFLLAAVLGFLPGTALLYPAFSRLWNARESKVARFLLAWVIGYISYLELVSSKPGTYTVQVMFPAFALAVAFWVTEREKQAGLPRGCLIPWPPLAAVFALVLLGAPFAFTGERPALLIVPALAAVAVLFFLSARTGRGGDLGRWVVVSGAAFSLFAITLLGLIMPGLEKIWPARQIQSALTGCPAGPVAVMGFREPTAKFVLQSEPKLAEPETIRANLVEGRASYLAGEARDDTLKTLQRFQYRRPRPLGCVEAYNVMTGCPLYFTIVSTADVASCTALEKFTCSDTFRENAEAAKAQKSCD